MVPALVGQVALLEVQVVRVVPSLVEKGAHQVLRVAQEGLAVPNPVVWVGLVVARRATP